MVKSPKGKEVSGMEAKIVYFENSGKENTKAVLDIVGKRIKELGIKSVVVASTVGDTAARAVDAFPGVKVVAVTHNTGYREPNVQEFTAENKKLVESKGGTVLTTTHLFSGLSAAMRTKFNTHVTGEVVRNTLYLFGKGMKVVCEVAVMAADAGLVSTTEDCAVIAGTSRGADTAVVLQPVNSQNFWDLKVKEILCKPHL
jgi:hypothetical protein